MSSSGPWMIAGGFLAFLFVVWLLHAAVRGTTFSILAFTAFVSHLPVWVAALMFILFPPTLIAFLTGLAINLIYEDDEEPALRESSSPTPTPQKEATESSKEGETNRQAIHEAAWRNFLDQYARDFEPISAVSKGPRVVTVAFDRFKKGAIVELNRIEKNTAYLDGIPAAISKVATSTRPIDPEARKHWPPYK